jgi:hypothetical protein
MSAPAAADEKSAPAAADEWSEWLLNVRHGGDPEYERSMNSRIACSTTHISRLG